MTDRARRSSGRLLIVFGPVLALGAVGALLAMVAATTGWHTDLMHAVAAGLGAIVMLLAVALFYLQTGQRRAADVALHNAESQVDSVVESAMDAIITVDENQRIVLFNTAAAKVFRYPRTEVLGQALEMLMPARLRDNHRQHIARFGTTGTTSRRMGNQTVLIGQRAGGAEFPI